MKYLLHQRVPRIRSDTYSRVTLQPEPTLGRVLSLLRLFRRLFTVCCGLWAWIMNYPLEGPSLRGNMVTCWVQLQELPLSLYCTKGKINQPSSASLEESSVSVVQHQAGDEWALNIGVSLMRRLHSCSAVSSCQSSRLTGRRVLHSFSEMADT